MIKNAIKLCRNFFLEKNSTKMQKTKQKNMGEKLCTFARAASLISNLKLV